MWLLNSPHDRNSIPSLDLSADFLAKKFHRTEIAGVLLNLFANLCQNIQRRGSPGAQRFETNRVEFILAEQFCILRILEFLSVLRGSPSDLTRFLDVRFCERIHTRYIPRRAPDITPR